MGAEGELTTQWAGLTRPRYAMAGSCGSSWRGGWRRRKTPRRLHASNLWAVLFLLWKTPYANRDEPPSAFLFHFSRTSRVVAAMISNGPQLHWAAGRGLGRTLPNDEATLVKSAAGEQTIRGHRHEPMAEEPDDPPLRTMGGTAHLCGQPGLSPPAGPGREGLPSAVVLTGRAEADAATLAASIAFEELTVWHLQRPPAWDDGSSFTSASVSN